MCFPRPKWFGVGFVWLFFFGGLVCPAAAAMSWFAAEHNAALPLLKRRKHLIPFDVGYLPMNSMSMSGQFVNTENNEPFSLLDSVKRSALQSERLIGQQQTRREFLVEFLDGWGRIHTSIRALCMILDLNYPTSELMPRC